MNHLPLLIFPQPVPADKQARTPRPPKYILPSHERQVARLGPIFRELQATVPTAPATATPTVAELQAEAQPVVYDDLARNTEGYEGQLVRVRGEVTQVMEDGDAAQLRLLVDGDLDNVLFVRYPGYSGARVLADDEVDLVAQILGRVEVKTVLGQELTLPAAEAKWLQVVEE